MELRYPLLFILAIAIFIGYTILYKKKKIKYTSGSKIANTNYIKNTNYYQTIIKKYKLIINTIKVFCLISIIASCLLLARPAKIESTNNSQYNRDIFLCMDVSSSVDELNSELVKNLKETVKSLKGERFGISIFNASSVTLMPLTEDYDYILEVLDQIDKSFNINNSLSYDSTGDNYYYTRNYIISGTQEGAELRGSSLIGDGLASCIYNFSNLEEDRTRIIIFSTDNELSGTPIVSLSKATDISLSKKIKVFGIGTKYMDSRDRIELKSAVEKTHGKFYEHSSSTVKNIVNDIEKTSKSLLKYPNEVKQVDIPQVPFIIIIVSISIFIILSRKVKS